MALVFILPPLQNPGCEIQPERGQRTELKGNLAQSTTPFLSHPGFFYDDHFDRPIAMGVDLHLIGHMMGLEHQDV